MPAPNILPKTYQRIILLCITVLILYHFFAQQWNYHGVWGPRHYHDQEVDPLLSSSCPSSPPSIPFEPRLQSVNSSWRHLLSEYRVQIPVSIPARATDVLPLPRIQHRFGRESSRKQKIREGRRTAVKDVFQRSWRSYKAKAWMQDELAPISGNSKDTFGGWAATLVDSLDTLWIMDLKDDYFAAVDAALDLDFSPQAAPNRTINMFETTIRHLGGLLSAYDLAGCKNSKLLEKIVQLGDMVLASLANESHMPVPRWNPRMAVDGTQQNPPANGVLSELGSYTLEFTRLSQLTGDMRWYDAVQRITTALDQQQNNTKIPGLWPLGGNFTGPDFTGGKSFTLGAMADSTYEYLPKMYALLYGTEAATQYRNMYLAAVEPATQHLLFRPMLPLNEDVLIVGSATTMETRKGIVITVDPTGQHLSCFVGGMLALGGKLFDDQIQVQNGRRVTDGCIWTYLNSPLGIMPEVFKVMPCPSYSPNCMWDEAKWNITTRDLNFPKGFVGFSDTQYMLRPEAVESVFYMYRISGDQRLQDVAWAMFSSIEKHTRTTLGNAALRSVLTGDKVDSMESFWLAETLKYFYLIFSDPDVISLDDYVFNTEAHPFSLPSARRRMPE